MTSRLRKNMRAEVLEPARVIPAIRRLHANGDSLAYSQVSRGLVAAAEARFGSWRKAIETAGIDYDALGLKVKRYSDKEMLDWLRLLAEERSEMTLVELSKERRYRSTVDRFGNLERALARAKITDWPVRQKQRWTKDRILADMRALAREGKAMSVRPSLYDAAKRYFGSLQAAAEIAGVEVRAPRKRTRKEVLASLRAIAKEYGTVTNALADNAGVRSAVEAEFGSLTEACEAAGVLGYERALSEEHARREDPEALLDELRSIAKRLKRPVVRRDLTWNTHQALLRHFDSLEAARERAGLPHPEVPRLWSRERALAELRAEHRRKTRMTRAGLKKAGRGDLLAAIATYVGSLEQARRIAHIPMPVPLKSSHVPFQKVWDGDRVIEEIEERVAANLPLAPSTITRPLMSAACRYWGSWRNAVEVAGHDYSEHVLRQDRTDEELLDLVRTIAAKQPDMTLDELRRLPFNTTLYRHFGTLEAAAERAGVADWPKRTAFPVLSKKELRAHLRERLDSGQPIRWQDVDRHVRFSMTRIHPRWRIALARLGIVPAAASKRRRKQS